MYDYIIIGCGSIGQALVKTLRKKDAEKSIVVVTADERGKALCKSLNVQFIQTPLTVENYIETLDPLKHDKTIMLNVSVNVSSIDLIEWCQSRRVRYLDTCVEPWPGGYNTDLGWASTNASMRMRALQIGTGTTPTALIAHGMNPGFISYMVQAGVDKIQENLKMGTYKSKGAILRDAGVQVVQLAEYDSQYQSSIRDTVDFANTWSVDGFISEAQQFAELGWGTHETPRDNVKVYSDRSAVMTSRGLHTRVKSFTPTQNQNPYAYLIPHHEAHSIKEMLRARDYCPTVYYAYTPCIAAHSSLISWAEQGIDWRPTNPEILDDVEWGSDEIGALFIAPTFMYWAGYNTCISKAREFGIDNATTYQVIVSILAGISQLEEFPNAGVVEAESLPYKRVMEEFGPMLGEFQTLRYEYSFAGEGPQTFDKFLISKEEKQ